MGLRKKNSDYLAVKHENIEFVNWEAERLLRGTNQISKCSSGYISFEKFDIIFWR